MSVVPRSPAIAAEPTAGASARSSAPSITWLISQYRNTAPSGGSALITVPSGMTMSSDREVPELNGVRGSNRYLNATPTRRLGVERGGVDARSRLARGPAEVDFGAPAALAHLDAHAVLLVVVDAVAVGEVLAHPLAVGDRLQRQLHPLGRGVADVAHRAEHRIEAVAPDGLAQQALAELEPGHAGLHVGGQDLAEADVVEDQAPRLAHRLAAAEQRAGRARARLVDVVLGEAEAAGHHAAHVELVGLHVDEAGERARHGTPGGRTAGR